MLLPGLPRANARKNSVSLCCGFAADHPAKKIADLLPWGDAFKPKAA